MSLSILEGVFWRTPKDVPEEEEEEEEGIKL